MHRPVIVLFPRFADPAPIRRIRSRFDPLAEWVEPHLTLVFPFETDLDLDELRGHVETALRGTAPFVLRLQGVTGSEDQYLFLNVKRGNDAVIELHDRLYTGPLRPHLRTDHSFVPHLTVGRLATPQAFRTALAEAEQMTESFETVVAEVALYRVLPGGERPIAFTVPLPG